jgi:hypothetical protein
MEMLLDMVTQNVQEALKISKIKNMQNICKIIMQK